MIFQGKAITCQWLDDGLARLHFDLQNESVNKFNQLTLQELKQATENLQKLDGLQGVIISSGKDSFIVGADITEFLGLFNHPEEELRQWVDNALAIFNAVEDLPCPTVTAVNGIALGGGFEMCLSSDFRVASEKALVGLPETKLGIYPGFGGTVRLSRLIGADNAIEWIASGSQKKPDAALKDGAVDAVVAPENLDASAIALLKDAVSGKIDWRSRRAQKTGPLQLNPIESMMVFEGAKAFVAGKAGPNYPAPVAAIKSMQKGATFPRDQALECEATGFIKVAKSDVAANLVQLFLSDQYLKSIAKKAAKSVAPVKKASVLGAGIMGGGVAYQSSRKGVPIVMKDINDGALEIGLNEASKLLSQQVKRGRMDAAGMAKVLNGINPTLSYDELQGVDLVVEAVVENPKVKKMVLAETEKHIAADTILTSNTSTISITSLAEGLQRPENFCGMHFFNPVHKMPLVEVIRGEKSSDAAIARTVAYAAKMGKTPIVVNDCPGFLVNRILFPYFGGFQKLLSDGADFARIDKVMEKFGWPMGPAYLMDVVGMDTAHHADAVMAEGFPDRMSYDQKTALDAMFEAERFGQKNGKGFYAYEKDRRGKLKKKPDPIAYELIKQVSPESKEFSDQEIIDRLMIPMVLETLRCLEENIVATPQEADMALIYGLGFPPFRGGAVRYLDSIGLRDFIATAEGYADLGALYTPTAGLIEKAEAGGNYYPKSETVKPA
ncbi:fatty acid oxidation complex subunit alpha FadB [Pelagibaculum spongiae]|uniref:enoyl-CoA hydratase n=1 Tax=Pelagibaculum spongiae TaxID=2080658 RepID=A0A2V1GUE0_9GAMM|nr:fatty acid oxidation complex subunit alpha FadB [Pelagibaculum spongiae]PVZ69629.1 fatty acid oxidation complex subunit alpha FadB [Pelagibaculum spongiae]